MKNWHCILHWLYEMSRSFPLFFIPVGNRLTPWDPSIIKCGMKLLTDFQTATVQKINFIPHFTRYVNDSPCWDLIWWILVKLLILGSMVSHQRIWVGLSQSARVGEARFMLDLPRWIEFRVLVVRIQVIVTTFLQKYSQDWGTYNNLVKSTYSWCPKDVCAQMSRGNTEWLLRYNGVN